jgi:hypothetical protein
MEIVTVSKFLKNMKVWHKVEGRYIRTKKMRVKIPKVTDKVAYLVGVITGDGTIVACKRKKGGYHYLIRLWGSKEKLTHMPKLLSDLFCCKSKIFKDKRKRNCYFIDVRGAALFAYFVQFGLPVGKKRELAVPKSIAGNPSLFRNYMLGLIETDGHVHNQRVQLKQRDENFLEELVKLLEKNLSIKSNPPKVNYTEGKPYYYIRFPITLLQSDST